MKIYPAYKDSGIDWVGEIPEHWDKKRFKYFVFLINNKSEGNNIGFKIALENIESGTGKLIEGTGAFDGIGNLFNKGDVLFNKLRPYLCKAVIAPDNGIGVGELLVLRAREGGNNRFILYRVLSDYFISMVNGSTFGAKMPRANWDFIGDMKLPYPSSIEQQAIADYLDKKTGLIDGLIEKKKRQIDLLKEQRQAVINQAVTKGINPNVEMKDSGIEWIGKIPKHWVVKPIKHIKSEDKYAFVDGPFGSNLKTIHFIENGDVLVIESGCITSGQFGMPEYFKTITKEHFETIKRSECKAGDIIISKIGANFGMSGVLPDLSKKSVVSGNSMKLTINTEKNCTDFIHFQLLFQKNNGEIFLLVNMTAQPALSLGGMNDMKMAIPPKDEQEEIVKYIKTVNDKIDHSIIKAEKQIELLQEYRTALISEAVTGKIDVRKMV